MKKTKANILIDDDDDDVLVSADLLLRQHFDNVTTLNDPKKINSILNNLEIDVFLLDMNYQKGSDSGKEGLYWLNHILSIQNNAAVVFMTAYGEIDLAVNAMKQGAIDFILKPWKNEKMLQTINKALLFKKSNKKIDKFSNENKSLRNNVNRNDTQLLGKSNAISKVKATINKVANTDASVLLLGENGTGKYVVAKEIHQNSLRKDKIFVHVVWVP